MNLYENIAAHSMGLYITTVLAMVGVYFLPTIISLARGHRHTPAIIAVNLLTAWTGIGWLVAFIWSITPAHRLRSI